MEYLIIVNKEHSLSSKYIPSDLIYPNVYCDVMDEKKFLRREVAYALEDMFQSALLNNIELVAISGFRSFERQDKIYNDSILKNGIDYTSRYIAKPGESEHQTGLAMDVSTKGLNYELEEKFENTKEGIWLRENCYKFGFVIRYPKGKENKTGYSYEPWHIRYVGERYACIMMKKNIVLEELI